MIRSIEFQVRGEPKPQPRPRAQIRGRGTKAYVHTYTPSTADDWRRAVESAIVGKLPAEPWAGPCALEITAYFERLKKAPKRKAGKSTVPGWPDWDNIGKLICDVLNGRLFIDDRQVMIAMVVKRQCRPGHAPGVKVRCWQILPSDVGLTGETAPMLIEAEGAER